MKLKKNQYLALLASVFILGGCGTSGSGGNWKDDIRGNNSSNPDWNRNLRDGNQSPNVTRRKNNLSNTQKIVEGVITPSGINFDLMRVSRTSTVNAKKAVLTSASEHCLKKEKVLLPIRVENDSYKPIGFGVFNMLLNGLAFSKYTYRLSFSCVDPSGINTAIKNTTDITSPPEGMAGLYLMRPNSSVFASALLYHVEFDGTQVGTLSVGSFLHGHIKPGKHSLSIKIEGKTKVHIINTKVNENLILTLSPGWSSVAVKETKSNVAKELITRYTHSLDNMFLDKKKF